jgi:AraC-like DNA-binding protein
MVQVGRFLVERPKRLIDVSRDDDVIFSLKHKGVCGTRQYGRTALLSAGNGMIFATGAPYTVQAMGASEGLGIMLSRERLGLPRGAVSRLCVVPVDEAEPAFLLLDRYVTASFAALGANAERDLAAHRSVAVELLAILLWQMASGAESSVTTAQIYLARLQRLVQDNLFDPRLDAGAVARALGVSVRTVYSAFAAVHTTPAAYIRRRRLESAATRLRCSRVAITDLAIGVGFSDVAQQRR